MTIVCPFQIKTSHIICDIGFKGNNKIEIVNFRAFENIIFNNKQIASINFEKKDDTYCLVISAVDNLDIGEIQNLVLQIAKVISFYLNIDECSPLYGTFFVDADLFNLQYSENRESPLSDSVNQLVFHEICSERESLEIESRRKFDLSSISFSSYTYKELIEYFYEGLRSELFKSKFYHWFLILEKLEKCKKYKEQLKLNQLFSNEEKEKIKNFAKSFCDNRKKDILMNALDSKYTIKNRAEKLYEFLRETLSISGEIEIGGGKYMINLSGITEVIEIRHKLFHAGEKFNEKILWDILFPTVIGVLRKLVIEKYEL